MREQLMTFLASPCCKSDLELLPKKIEIYENEGKIIKEALLICKTCSFEFPVIDGIPRLDLELSPQELTQLKVLKNSDFSSCSGERKFSSEHDRYDEIEKEIRKIMKVPTESNYLRERVENDIVYRIKGCELQDKYVQTINSRNQAAIKSILDVGGMQGGLAKCLDLNYKPDFTIILDKSIDWTHIALLRNPNAQIIRADAARLPFKKDSIDLVISQATLEHIEEYRKVVTEMVKVTKHTCFIAWSPNKLSLYDFGHLDAPVTLFNKNIAKKVALAWHRMRRTNRSPDSIIRQLDKTFYISTRVVRKIMKSYGTTYNMFVEFACNSLRSEYSYRGRGLKKIFSRTPFLAKLFFRILVILSIEPQCYYLLRK
jgi:uncharacterized protein YbaR (Trm112 family)/ubiquinone/menaquinone biosynthesis C-methylase UbiE